MCDWGVTEAVLVKIPVDLACDGRTKWRLVGIDACIAPIVRALQLGGIDMQGSCCGHGKKEGNIYLQDGRLLLILNPEHAELYLASAERLNVCKYIEEMGKE